MTIPVRIEFSSLPGPGVERFNARTIVNEDHPYGQWSALLIFDGLQKGTLHFLSPDAPPLEPGVLYPLFVGTREVATVSMASMGRLDVTRWFESLDEEASEAPIRDIFHYCLDAMEVRDFACMALLMSDMMPYLGKYDIAVMLAPLSITVPCSTRVPGRSAYYLAVREELGRRGRVDVGPLLQGLE